MVGDQATDSLDDESGLEERPSRRHRRAVSLIALAAVVFVFASAVYLNMSGASLLGAFLSGASQAQTQSPADDGVQGGGLIDPAIQPPLGTQIPRTTGLVRDGATGAVVQRFGGMNDKPPLTLIASVQIKEAAVARGLIRDLNALPAFPAGFMSCPLDDGSYFRIIFAYVRRHPRRRQVGGDGLYRAVPRRVGTAGGLGRHVARCPLHPGGTFHAGAGRLAN
jgi:hypothetical protein